MAGGKDNELSSLDKLHVAFADELYVNALTESLDLTDPKWEEAGLVHDWRNHVPICIQEHWNNLTTDARMCVALMAMEMADRENWE